MSKLFENVFYGRRWRLGNVTFWERTHMNVRYIRGLRGVLARAWVLLVLGCMALTVCVLTGCQRSAGDEGILLETIPAVQTGSETGVDDSVSGGPLEKSSGNSGEDSGETVSERDFETVEPATVESRLEKIFVYVCGSVRQPGVYEFQDGARIYEAVEAAGGMLEEADSRAVNLAAELKDQMQIYIPSQAETAGGQSASGNAQESYVLTGDASNGADSAPVSGGADSQAEAGGTDSRININTAQESQLTTLPGIGPSKAKDIIEYREAHGAFSSVEELMDIPGIKSGVFDKIKDKVTVD